MRRQHALVLGLIAFPVALFFALLAGQIVNIPFMDDYGLLHFVSGWTQLASPGAKLMALLTVQHNEYKIVLPDAIVLLDYAVLGHLNFAVLSVIGNLYALGLLLTLCAMWKDDARVGDHRWVLFVPVSWLLMQLQYYSLLDWPLTTLQNVGALFFCILTIYLVSRDTPRSFLLSLLCLMLAISSSGNGFFVVPVGCLILLQHGRRRYLLGWLAAAAGLFSGYVYRYNFHNSQAHADHSLVSSLYHISPLYTLSMLGSSIARYGSYVPSAVLGVCLCGIFVLALSDKLYVNSPALFYSMLFLLINAVAVSGLRSDLGIAQSLVSRYRIYSNLMLALAYLYLAGKMQARLWLSPTRKLLAATLILASVVAFNAASMYGGYKLLRSRTELTREGLRRWEQGEPSITIDPGPENEDLVIRRQRLAGNYEPNDGDLREAIALGIYTPPQL